MTTIEIYPECLKPSWLRKNAWCFCLGEGKDKYTVATIGKSRAFLLTQDGKGHGWESFDKLYRTLEEINERLDAKKTSVHRKNKKD